MGNLIESIDPKLFTNISLEEMRAKQEAFEAKRNGSVISIDPEYVHKVHAPFEPVAEINYENIKRVFFSWIKIFLLEKSKRVGYEIKCDFSMYGKKYAEVCQYLLMLLMNQTDKGLMLVGESGAGKSTILRSILFQTYRDFAGGNYIPIIYSTDIINHKLELLGTAYNHCAIDDLGIEVNYAKGNGRWIPQKQDVAEEVYYILEKRFNAGKRTHITTNMSLNDCGIVYGKRSEWRFNEWFYIINL